MGLGVLEDKHFPYVPGTVLLEQEAASSTQHLKHGRGRNANVVLSPQPSTDPNDPLNWPGWKKELVIVILCFGAMLNAGTNAPLLNASYYPMAVEVNVDLTTLVMASGYNVLAAGLSGPFISALSRKYGKRPIFLASTLFDIIGTAVAEAKISYNYLLAGRIIQGFAMSAFESLVIAVVGDLYFVHQRGLRIAALNFILQAAANLASIICGQVFASLGWLWLFHLFQIFLVIQFVLMFLFCPETTYVREARYETDTNMDGNFDDLDKDGKRIQESKAQAATELESAITAPSKKTFVQELAIFTGVYSDENILKCLCGPLLTLLNPITCYTVTTAAILNCWLVGGAIVLSGLLSGPPWLYNAAQVGYAGTGPFIGGLLASVVTAAAGDNLIKYIARRNRGVYEPEFRLLFMVLAAITAVPGFFAFGYTLSIGASVYLVIFCQGLLMFGVFVGIWSSMSYGLDAFRNLASETFVMIMTFKNLMFFGLSHYANDWVANKGPQEMIAVFQTLRDRFELGRFVTQQDRAWNMHELVVFEYPETHVDDPGRGQVLARTSFERVL
ncbi:hypothetical protein AYO21_00430 [Fonsecaea monophora]|uniref:Major facilitator superfamily (MFS) profile domain-containing protein n=1 Tax=Fonsecaea monophora TaxID=254056 RepID=A0A177FP22_9EURO|nr:hypothetical protein AYO21_00430 [Fonsecaea monophora]OAG45082.1 hypothetical protein AYO21_00430 [Fonsecaea monophora]